MEEAVLKLLRKFTCACVILSPALGGKGYKGGLTHHGFPQYCGTHHDPRIEIGLIINPISA